MRRHLLSLFVLVLAMCAVTAVVAVAADQPPCDQSNGQADSHAPQCDHDGDGVSNRDDADDDNDGVSDDSDNCRFDSNSDQRNQDRDGKGDVCDPTPTQADQTVDSDADGLTDHSDNCPGAYNPNQADSDGDGAGDACDDTPHGSPPPPPPGGGGGAPRSHCDDTANKGRNEDGLISDLIRRQDPLEATEDDRDDKLLHRVNCEVVVWAEDFIAGDVGNEQSCAGTSNPHASENGLVSRRLNELEPYDPTEGVINRVNCEVVARYEQRVSSGGDPPQAKGCNGTGNPDGVESSWGSAILNKIEPYDPTYNESDGGTVNRVSCEYVVPVEELLR